jgi:addiction module HigA family antidote
MMRFMIQSFRCADTMAFVHDRQEPALCQHCQCGRAQAATVAMIKNGMRPIHPGEILREDFLVPLGMSANALALALDVPAPRINDIVRERRAVTADTALRLARYFDSSPEFWLNLQTAYDLKTLPTRAEITRRVRRRQPTHA